MAVKLKHGDTFPLTLSLSFRQDRGGRTTDAMKIK
jgi:hypothetical protein